MKQGHQSPIIDLSSSSFSCFAAQKEQLELEHLRARIKTEEAIRRFNHCKSIALFLKPSVAMTVAIAGVLALLVWMTAQELIHGSLGWDDFERIARIISAAR